MWSVGTQCRCGEPYDIARAGFDDMQWNVIIQPGITAVAQLT
jgi:hypothetical protein